MFIFPYSEKIALLLLFLGSQRILANPTSSLDSSSINISTAERKEPYVSQTKTIYDEKEKTSSSLLEGQKKHHLDCQADSDYIQKQMALTSKLLDDGEKIVQKQKDISTDETVLVLGKAGSGKTSLIQFLTQNPKLQSKIFREDTGEYIIEDGEKIGTSATESFTLYPELVRWNSTITFCDSPGFHDSRGSAHEIASMYVMKSITKIFKKTKILLLEKHGSLQYGVFKDTFINTLRHLNDFLVDIDRYKDNIVLIATKLPFSYRMTGESDLPEFITEEMHIESILAYLNQTETSLSQKLVLEINNSQKEFYTKVIRLLQSLQTRDGNGKALRVNLFRRPYKSGSLKNMALLEKNKESLLRTVNSLDYIEVEKNDFDFTLSNEAKIYLECLLKLNSDIYKSKVNELSFKLNEYVTNKTQNYTSLYQVLSELVALHDALKQLSGNLDKTRKYDEFFDKINGFMSNQKIPLQINYNRSIFILEKYEEMLLKFVDTSEVFTPSSWTLPLREALSITEDKLEWYKTLNQYIVGLSSYETQKNKTEIYTSIFDKDSTSTNNLMTLFMDVTGRKNLKLFIESLENTRKKKEVETITETLLQQTNITCDASGRLTIKGFYVRLSEFNSEHLIQSYCNHIALKEVALLAVHTVFLDEDTNEMFAGVNMFIAAPKWEVIGQRRFSLNGQPGWGIIDNDHVNNGKNGIPGQPGGNGGSFFGLGLQFLNGENLRIDSSGGRGGPGVSGAKGMKGRNGRDAADKLVQGVYNQSYRFIKGTRTVDLKNSFSSTNSDVFSIGNRYRCCRCCEHFNTEVELILEDGDCGEPGGSGGMGGEGGMGGLPGDQQLIELGDSSLIKLESQNGSLGTRGRMGEYGDKGKDGIGMICVKVEGFYGADRLSDNTYWKCESTNSTSPACNSCPKLDQTVEHQYITTGIQQPAPKKSPDFSFYLLEFAVLMKSYNSHAIFNHIITEFKAEIQNKFSYNLNEMGMLLFKNTA